MNLKPVREMAIGLVVPAILIGIWHAVTTAGLVHPQVLPAPWTVVQKWVAYLLPVEAQAAPGLLGWIKSSELLVDAAGSMYRVLVGFAIGAALALPLNLGAGRATMFVRVILPAAVPFILSGVRIGIGTAFIVVIVSEMIAVNDGLGFRINEAREYFWSDKIMAGMISIGMLGLAIDMGMNRLNNYLLRWHRGLES